MLPHKRCIVLLQSESNQSLVNPLFSPLRCNSDYTTEEEAAGCDVQLGLQCGAVIARCVAQCQIFAPSCLSCVGSAAGACCPCLKKAFRNFPC